VGVLRRIEKELHLKPGERLYCVSSVFAPSGLDTVCIHWQHYDPAQGGRRPRIASRWPRSAGGYAAILEAEPGAREWKITVETEGAIPWRFIVSRFLPNLAGDAELLDSVSDSAQRHAAWAIIRQLLSRASVLRTMTPSPSRPGTRPSGTTSPPLRHSPPRRRKPRCASIAGWARGRGWTGGGRRGT